MSRIADNILSILGECRVEGDTLFLPDRQLDRPTYQAVNKVLVNIGGKWNRKAKGHVFADGDPAELLNNVLMTGETVDLKKQYQFFPTPRPVAEQMCRMAELDSTCVVLEPSCGKGDLADVVSEAGVKVLYGLELNRDMERYLKGKPYTTMVGIDFLDFAKDDGIDHEWNRIVMNPPFTKQQDIDHILAAYDILAPVASSCRWCRMPRSSGRTRKPSRSGSSWTATVPRWSGWTRGPLRRAARWFAPGLSSWRNPGRSRG